MRHVDPRLSPEVRWFLRSRGIPFPNCPPKFKTPEPGNLPGAIFDPERVDHVLRVFGHLRHTQGQWAGQPLKPDPWQIAYILAPTFGWVRLNERGQYVRIIRRLYVDLPRKNGKTTIAGGVAIYMITADHEAGAQGYLAAAGKDQARFCFDPVKAIAEQAPALKPHVLPQASQIIHPRSKSYLRVVSSVAQLLHGANVHFANVDELHIHKSPDLIDALETGTASREQPLVMVITTPDDGRPETPYDLRRKYIENLASGAVEDPSVYGVIWAADEDDDPFKESTWKKANPGYGISPTKAFIETAALGAKQSPTELFRFLRLHLGIRTSISGKKFIPIRTWTACTAKLDDEQLRELPVYGGLDLASTIDLAALALCFVDGERFRFLWQFWTPAEGLRDREHRDRVPYARWVKDGLITATDSPVIDYDAMRLDIGAWRDRFPRLREISYDPWNASGLVRNLEIDGFDMHELPQTLTKLTDATKELQRLVIARRLEHDGNPVARWMANNLVTRSDVNGNVAPDKKKSTDRIDGMVAAIDALDRALRNHQAEGSVSRIEWL